MKKINLFALTTIIIILICPFGTSTPKTSDTYNLPALSYMGLGDISMNTNDQISLDISSGSIINVYIMTDMQWNTLVNSGGLIWEYKIRFKDMTSVEYTYTVDSNDNYYVVFYNKGLFSVYIEYDISYIPYNPYNPYNPFSGIIILIIICSIMFAVVLPIALFINRKKKTNKQTVKQNNIVLESTKKGYCSNCGSIIMDESNYCKNCGNVLK